MPTGSGGGVFIGSMAKLAITSSTITGNSSGTNGGGLYCPAVRFAVTPIRHSTIDNNQAVNSAAEFSSPDGVMTIDHTIVATNTATHGPDLTGLIVRSIQSEYSADRLQRPERARSKSGPLGRSNGNFIGGPIHGSIDPRLGTLADNGGPVQTQSILAGSKAIDAGNPAAVAGAGTIPLSDSRGAPVLSRRWRQNRYRRGTSGKRSAD